MKKSKSFSAHFITELLKNQFKVSGTLVLLLFTISAFGQWTSGTGTVSTTSDVGIGTSAPTFQLHIQKSVGSIMPMSIPLFKAEVTGTSPFNAFTIDGAILSTDGSLGIGTNTPQEGLHLYHRNFLMTDATNNDLFSVSEASTGGGNLSLMNGVQPLFTVNNAVGIRIYKDWNSRVFWASVDGSLHLNNINTGTEYFSADNAGGMTIRNASNGSPVFDINPTGILTFTNPYTTNNVFSVHHSGGLNLKNGTSNNDILNIDASGNLLLNNATNALTVANGNIVYSTGVSEKMRVNSGGDITTQGSLAIMSGNTINCKLYNDGLIWAREVKVNLDVIVPDYVFTKDYKLMPIRELEAYLHANSHLPNIPSATEFEKEGTINVGQMQMKLLEKVEELTLYMISLKNENDELKKRLSGLENR